MTTGTDFDPADMYLLLGRYDADGKGAPRRAPWVWSLLKEEERAALARMIDVFLITYNAVYAVTEEEVVPPCWRHHHGLAHDLAVQLWLWYWAHCDPKATPGIVGDYHDRRLPAFRSRVDRWLGRTPMECRRGDHRDTWRSVADKLVQSYPSGWPRPEFDDELAVEMLGGLHFGFPVDTV